MEEKAARAYDLAALKYWGPSTHINFPVMFFFFFNINFPRYVLILLSCSNIIKAFFCFISD